jgi:integrase
MFNKALEWGWMEVNPFTLFRESPFYKEENNRVRYLEKDEFKKLFDALEKQPSGQRKPPEYLRGIVMAAILTGIRKDDLLNLKWENYKGDAGRLYFYEKKKRKMSDKVLNQDMITLLESIPRGKSDYIFTGEDGGPLKSITRSFKTALRRAGIKDFRFHDLRHTSASYLLMRGASLKSVQQQLGHSTLKMTERYAHISDQFQREEVNRLNGLLPFPLASSKKLVRSEEKISLPIYEEAYNA